MKSLTEGKHKRKDSRLPYSSADDSRLNVSRLQSYITVAGEYVLEIPI